MSLLPEGWNHLVQKGSVPLLAQHAQREANILQLSLPPCVYCMILLSSLVKLKPCSNEFFPYMPVAAGYVVFQIPRYV